MSVITVGSLFSGVGGLDLGLERAGMAVKWQVEIDPYCRKILAKHWPGVKRYEDVHECGQHNLERVDVIAGGFPCQPVSLAGKRRGQEDQRWLWPEFARLIRELRPRVALMENVPGLLVRGMGDVLGDLAACGYDAEWDCVSAAALGAPHIRDRVFIVAHPAIFGRKPRRTGDAAEGERRGQSDRGSVESHVADADGAGLEGQRVRRTITERGWWAVEPDVGRVVDGTASRVDRLRGLGNAVVPQVAEYIGRLIVEAWMNHEETETQEAAGHSRINASGVET